MTITAFWQDAFSFAGFTAGLSLFIGWLSLDVGAIFLGVALAIVSAAVIALLLDGALRLFRRLTGLRVRIVIERVR